MDYHLTAAIECTQGRKRSTVVTQIADKVVLQDRQLMPPCQLDQTLTPLECESRSGRILKGRHHIEKLHSVAAEDCLQDIDLNTVLVGRHGQTARLAGREIAERPEIGGILDQNNIAGIDQRACNYIYCLLRAAYNQKLIFGNCNSLPAEISSHLISQLRMPFSRTVA